MKTIKKSEIAAFLVDFQKRLSAVTKAVNKRSAIESDASQFEATITKLGEPNYNDDEKISLLASTQLKLKSCQGALEKQNTKIGEELAQLAEMLDAGATFACSVIMEIVANRHETITNCLRPFCANRASAEYLARQTDAGRGGHGIAANYKALADRVRKYSGMKSGAEESPAEYAESEAAKVIGAAEKIERVLAEATSTAPNLMQFIPFAPSEVGEAETQPVTKKTKTPASRAGLSPKDEAPLAATGAGQNN